MSALRLGVVGIGKIARDQHLPAIAADPGLELTAIASRHGRVDGVPNFPTIQAMIAEGPALDAVSLCTPPQGRHAIARAALEAGLHLMLEKPPGATVGEVADLANLAAAKGLTLYTTWHSREAAGVEAARDWLKDRTIERVAITWKEDVRHWHPGQEWIFAAGGLGIFDPTINALSIVTTILPEALILDSAELSFPANRDAPIAATMAMTYAGRAPVTADLDFLQTGPQTWDIVVETDRGTLTLSLGGAKLTIDGKSVDVGENREYPRLYRRFAELVESGRSDVDVRPFQLAGDAFLLGKRIEVEPFEF
ncbi:MAG: Gfo/Idh/MocA family protein [Sphingomonas sp.]